MSEIAEWRILGLAGRKNLLIFARLIEDKAVCCGYEISRLRPLPTIRVRNLSCVSARKRN